MSYIRCLSNPESLYIIGTLRGQVEFCGDEQGRMLPAHVFHGVLSRWLQRYEPEVVRYRGATIMERKTDFKWELDYEGWSDPIVMWKVTLWYIASRNDFRNKK